MKLPIDVVLGTDPPKFKWRQTVHTMNGTSVQECEGLLPPSCERAVEAVIGIAKQALMDCAMLRGQVQSMTDRVDTIASAPPKPPERIAETPLPPPATTKRHKQ